MTELRHPSRLWWRGQACLLQTLVVVLLLLLLLLLWMRGTEGGAGQEGWME